MATFRTTVTSAFNAATVTIDSATLAVQTAAIGINMLHNWAELEQKKQAAGQVFDIALVEEEAEHKAAERIAAMNMEKLKFSQKSPEHAVAYEAALARIKEIKATSAPAKA